MMIVVTVAIKHCSCFLLFSLWYLGVIASGISVNKLRSPNPIKFDVSSCSVLTVLALDLLPGFHTYSCSTPIMGTPAGLCLARCAQAGRML